MRQLILLSIIYFFSCKAFAQQNVGIGTTRPTEKLHVAGNVKADTIKPTAIKFTPNAGEGKVLTSDATGVASWKVPEKSIFKATGFQAAFNVAPNATRVLTDWNRVELDIGANSIFVNAQGDLFVLKGGIYRVSAKVTTWFDDPGDSHDIQLSILVNGTKRATNINAVATNDNALDVNHQYLSSTVSSVFQLSAQDKISFEFYNSAILSNTSAQVRMFVGEDTNDLNEFVVEQF